MACQYRCNMRRNILFVWVTMCCLIPCGTDAGGTRSHPRVMLGGALGVSDHFGKSVSVDAVSGASVQLPDEKVNDVGAAVGGYGDFGLVRLGPGDLGLQLLFLASFPQRYIDIGFVPRYRFLLKTGRTGIPTVEPWLGGSLFLTFEDRFSKDFYFMFAGALGCDISLGKTGWVLGLAVYINAVNPFPVKETVEINGESHRLSHRRDSVIGLLNFAYRVL